MKNIEIPAPAALTTIACLLGGLALGYFLAPKPEPTPAKPLEKAIALPGAYKPVPVPHGEYRAKGPPALPAYFRGVYLDLAKMALTDLLYETDPSVIDSRLTGRDWPDRAVTMVGLKRLDNIQLCAEDVLLAGIPGDFLEAGAWRGGASMFMKAILKEYGDTTRTVWVADSFEGLPPPDPANYPADEHLKLNQFKELAVSLEEVQANFERFGLMDDHVKFLKGWFKDTLRKAPIEKLAVLRVDGDLYESTMDTLGPLYPKLSPGGYCIVDDYFNIRAQKDAVDTYRREHGIAEEIQQVDWAAGYWQKRK